MSIEVSECPICKQPGTEKKVDSEFESDYYVVACGNCGKFKLAGQLILELESTESRIDDKLRGLISHHIRSHENENLLPKIDSRLAEDIVKQRYPSPLEKLHMFIDHLGVRQQGMPGTVLTLDTNEMRAPICSIYASDVSFCVDTAKEYGYIDLLNEFADGSYRLQLTIRGWEIYEEITTSLSSSNTAFMAMSFNNEELNGIVDDHFVPEVEKTGLELRKVIGDHQPAGLIDDHIVVAIRTSKIVIADLTDGNKGAYFEAGLAEGLGIPVIYTCHEDVFDAKDGDNPNKPHFDTNHRHTVKWNSKNPGIAANKIKDIIRATLPNEVKMIDDESSD